MELWKDIPSRPGYQASSLGRIRSVDRWVRVSKCDFRKQVGVIRKPKDNGGGYLHINFGVGKGSAYVHRLVAEAFIGPIQDGLWVCHNDGDKANNTPENLRYDTAKNNEADKRKHGTRQWGSKSNLAVLSEVQVEAIRDLSNLGYSESKLAKVFGVSQPTISRIFSARTWRK